MIPRPAPEPTALTRGFWEAARRHELVVQKCSACGLYRHYPRVLCPDCHSAEWQWTPVSGRGTIFTLTVTHRAFHPAWADRVPYVCATIELDEGVRMVSDLPAEDTTRAEIGMRVEVFFDEQPDDGATLPRFRLCQNPPAYVVQE